MTDNTGTATNTGYPIHAIGITEPTYTTVPMNTIPGACPWCSTPWSAILHGGRCPKVKAKEYHENGTLKRVEFYEEP
jgi:hypothetical protein